MLEIKKTWSSWDFDLFSERTEKEKKKKKG